MSVFTISFSRAFDLKVEAETIDDAVRAATHATQDEIESWSGDSEWFCQDVGSSDLTGARCVVVNGKIEASQSPYEAEARAKPASKSKDDSPRALNGEPEEG